MSLSRWKFDPRLLSIKAGNTRVAEGLHHIHGTLTSLDAQVKDARQKLPLESVPQAKLIAEMNEKSSECARQCRTLMTQIQQCSTSVNSALDSLCGDLDQLDKMLTGMQQTGNELRSFSFDGVVQLLTHTDRAMTGLEKQALAENNRRFWPWIVFWSLMVVGSAWLVFNPAQGAMNLFGDVSPLHKMVIELVGFLGLDLGILCAIGRVYTCFKPTSPGMPKPKPIFEAWIIALGAVYTFWAGLMVVIWSFSLSVWMSGNPAPDWWGFITFGGLLVMFVAGVIFVADCVDPPK